MVCFWMCRAQHIMDKTALISFGNSFSTISITKGPKDQKVISFFRCLRTSQLHAIQEHQTLVLLDAEIAQGAILARDAVNPSNMWRKAAKILHLYVRLRRPTKTSWSRADSQAQAMHQTSWKKYGKHTHVFQSVEMIDHPITSMIYPGSLQQSSHFHHSDSYSQASQATHMSRFSQ